MSGYYCVAGGASAFHTISHMREAIQEKNLRAKVTDVTHELGVLSLQGQLNCSSLLIC
jgi:sarcosine dehydrogenase